jgi:hypothetical protein
MVPFFMEIITLMCWAIWKAGNDFIFQQINPLLENTKEDFRREFGLLLLRAKKSYSPLINQLMDSKSSLAWFLFLVCSIFFNSFFVS